MSDGDVVMKENGAEESKEQSKSDAPKPASSSSPVSPPSTPTQSTKNPDAEKLKEEGNQLFAQKHFAKATDCYSKGDHHATPLHCAAPTPHTAAGPHHV